MTGKLSKNFHGVGIGPLSNMLAVKTWSYMRKYGRHRHIQQGRKNRNYISRLENAEL